MPVDDVIDELLKKGEADIEVYDRQYHVKITTSEDFNIDDPGTYFDKCFNLVISPANGKLDQKRDMDFYPVTYSPVYLNGLIASKLESFEITNLDSTRDSEKILMHLAMNFSNRLLAKFPIRNAAYRSVHRIQLSNYLGNEEFYGAFGKVINENDNHYLDTANVVQLPMHLYRAPSPVASSIVPSFTYVCMLARTDE